MVQRLTKKAELFALFVIIPARKLTRAAVLVMADRVKQLAGIAAERSLKLCEIGGDGLRGRGVMPRWN